MAKLSGWREAILGPKKTSTAVQRELAAGREERLRRFSDAEKARMILALEQEIAKQPVANRSKARLGNGSGNGST